MAFDDVLRTARRIARTGSSVFMISDFSDAGSKAAGEELFQLARHTEITAVRCSDPLEATLPPPGVYAVTDGRERIELDTGFEDLRKRYAAEVSAQRDALDALLGRLAIPCIEAGTAEAPLTVLNHYFGAGS